MNLNKAQLIGRVTKDPELKATPSGMKIATFGVATNYTYKNKDGEKKETVSFHNLTAFGKVAETIAQWVKKGQEIYVEGRIEYQEWEKKDGGKAYRTNILVENFQFGAKAKGTEEKKKEDVIEYPEEEINPEDIPF